MKKECVFLAIFWFFVVLLSDCVAQGRFDPEMRVQSSKQNNEHDQIVQEFCASTDAQNIVREWHRGDLAYETVLVRGEWCPKHMNTDGIMIFLRSMMQDGEDIEHAKQRMLDEADRSFDKVFDQNHIPIWWIDHGRSLISLVIFYSV